MKLLVGGAHCVAARSLGCIQRVIRATQPRIEIIIWSEFGHASTHRDCACLAEGLGPDDVAQLFCQRERLDLAACAARYPCSTGYHRAMTNLTITIDEALLRRARIRALQQGESVNSIVRRYLESYAGGDRQAEAVASFLALADRVGGSSGEGGRSWSRDDLYDV